MGLTEIHNGLLQETVYYTKIPQGLEVFVLRRPGFQKKYAVISTKYGSIDSKFTDPATGQIVEVPDGIAHFLEHKLFESEEKPVFDRFAELGASANAYTSYTITSYLFSCTENFAESLVTLLDFVQHPYLTDENVEKEKGIIEQELRMYRDSPERRVYTNLLRALYHENPVRIEIGGTVESIYQITKEDLMLCYRTFYHPSNMALFVVGDVSPDLVVDIAAKHIRASDTRQDEIRRFYPDEPETVKEPRVVDELVVSRPIVYFGVKDATKLSGPELLRQTILTNILHKMLFGRTTDFYARLYEDGLINETFGAFYTGEIEFGYSMIGGETPDPQRLGDKLEETVAAAIQSGLSQESFERHKRESIGEFLHAVDSMTFIANNFISQHFKGASLFDFVELCEGLTLEDAERRLAEHFVPERMAISILNPKKTHGK